MSAFYNMSSLALGLTAWILAFLAIICRKQYAKVMLTSFACAGTAMVLEYFELRHRILIGDFSAIEDIYPTMAWVTLILLIGTVLLNTIAVIKNSRK